MKKSNMDKKINLTEKKKVNKKLILILITAVLVLFAGYLVYTNYDRINKSGSEQEMSQKEIDKLLKEVNKLIRLPEGVQPAIATINDIDTLVQEQKFFVGAKNGDKILIYQDKAILYDPDEHILINVGPVISGNGGNVNNNLPVNNQEQEVKINLDIRNGSGVSGAASKMAEELSDEYEIIQTIDAAKEYDGLILVSLTGKDPSELEKKFGVKAVDKLPEGEKLSIADFVIIIGK